MSISPKGSRSCTNSHVGRAKQVMLRQDSVWSVCGFSTNSFSLKERDRTGNTKKIQEQEYTLLQCLYQTFRHLVTFTEGILIKCQYRASLKPDCSHLENKTKFTDG